MKKLITFALLLSSFLVFTQEERKTLFGIVYDENGILENAHIVNHSTHQATFSNTDGTYRIYAKANDSIRYTSIGYTTIFKKLSKEDFNSYRRTYLKKKDYKLEEVLINNNSLTGNIKTDIQKANSKKRVILQKNTYTIYNPYKKTLPNTIKANLVQTDPTKLFEGLSISNSLTTNYNTKLHLEIIE